MKEGWKYERIGDISLRITDGSHNPPKGIERSEFLMLSSQNVQDGFLDLASVRFLPKESFDIEHKRTQASAGDVLLTIVGTIGRSCVLKGDEGNITFQRSVAIIKPKDDIINPYYLMYCFRSFTDKLNDEAHGAAQKGLYLKQLANITIPCPPLSEQQQIVDFLDAEFAKIDELKKQAEQSLQNAKDLFQAALKEMLTPKEGWKEVKLSQIGSINRGVSKHRPRNAPELMGDYLPLVQTGDVANSDKYIETYSSSYSKLGVEQSRVWEPGALCITIAANIGKASILNFKACFPDSVVGFIANPGTNIDFIYYQFCILQSILEANAPGAAQKNINLRILSELKLFVPEYKEQVRIAEKLDRLRETKNSLQSNYTRTIQLCADLKQALLRQVFE